MHVKHYHFIGIAGVGMSALAHVLLQKGLKVSGSDIQKNSIIEQLCKRGAEIFYSQKRENIKKDQIVVYSTAILEKNPEIIQARKLGCQLLHRSELLQKLLTEKKAIIVAGSHGKTTTSALLSYVLSKSLLDPSYIVGGFSPSLETNGRWGKGEVFVAEGDESDGSFLKSSPFGAILTNIDFDHICYWKTKQALLEGFNKFINSIENQDLFVYNGDDLYLSKLSTKGISFGFSSNVKIRAKNIRYQKQKVYFDVDFKGKVYCDIVSPLLGEHNVLNALSVFAMAILLGLDGETIRQAFNTFKGVNRRLEYKGNKDQIVIFDDYAHHPNEIKEVLQTLEKVKDKKRLVVVFQPHRYSRTLELFDDFIKIFQTIDHLVLTDIYSAGEDPIDGITSEALLEKLSRNKNIQYIPRKQLTQSLLEYLKPNDLVITLGAGDITQVSDQLQVCF